MPKVFFVTGCSSGFGHDLVQLLLNKGEHVVATARNPSVLEDFVNKRDQNFLPVKLDVKSTQDIETAFDAAITKFGRIDVLVNNAGYGLCGTFETLSRQQIRDQYDTNVFGVMDVTRRALQIMRTQKPPGGVIQQNSSMAGVIAVPMLSVYASSKAALAGWTASLAGEMKSQWNIRFNIIETGPFRTSGVLGNMVYGAIPQPDYDHMDGRAWIASFGGKEPGNPIKGAEAMYKLACMENPPLRAVLGDVALGFVRQKIEGDREIYNRPDVLEIVTNLDFEGDGGSLVADKLEASLGTKSEKHE